MDGSVFLILLVLATLVGLPIAAIVIANSRTRQLREEMNGLLGRVWQLETRVENLVQRMAAPAQTPLREPAQAAPVPQAAASPPEVEAPRTPEGVMPPAPAPPLTSIALPQFSSLEPATASDSRSLESRIGSQWFNRIGILAMLIGVAWFLKLAFDNRWIGPLGRVLIGLLAGAALIGWSERFHKRGYVVFSFSLKAIGSGTLYLSLWAAFQLYGLMPAGAAFAAMIAVTAFNGYMSWIQDSELLALYAIAGGLSTPLLVSTGGNHEVTLFTYLLILDLAVLVLVALRPWSRLLFVTCVGTVVFIAAWWSSFYTLDQAPRTAFFLCCFFIPFSLAPRLVRITLDPDESFQGWDALVSFALPVANAAVGFIGFYSLIDPSTADWAGPWLAVAFAAYYLVLMRLPETGPLHAGVRVLSPLHLTTAIVFLTIAIPLKTHDRWMTIGWLVEGAVLLWLSRRVQAMLLRAFGFICTVLGLGALLIMNPPAASRPILNERFGTYCVAIAVCAFIAWLARNSHDEQEPNPLMHWPNLAAAAVLAVNALILIAFSWEIHSYWWLLRWHDNGSYEMQRDYWMYAEFTYSAFFMLYGSALLTIGFLKRSAFLRWQALILIAATIGKVFLVDMSELSRGLRILSFIGLGVLLLCVSFVYQRDWLNLRGQKEQNP
ncbi:MAG: DUF2339 domain-containing protein [Terracidiphilus sp.]|jgi:uncharacterized membrane protein